MSTLTVLGASGRVGSEIVAQALALGHHVIAISRHPVSGPAPQPRLTWRAADVTDPDSIAEALAGSQIVLNALGLPKPPRGHIPDPTPSHTPSLTRGGHPLSPTPGSAATPSSAAMPGILTAGAQAIAAAAPETVVSLGAFGTGASAQPAGLFTRTLLRAVMRAELPDKMAADQTILSAHGIVLHAGPMTGSPPRPTHPTSAPPSPPTDAAPNAPTSAPPGRLVPLNEAPKRVFPRPISRATVAALMIHAALNPEPWRGQIMVPLER